MRSLLGALALLTAADAAAAPAPNAPEAPPRRPTFGQAADGQLAVIRAPGLAHPVLGTHDLYCPETPHPSPFVVIVLEPEQPRSDGEGWGTQLARHGFGSLVLEPKEASAGRVAAAIDALLANTATERPEPGCRADGRVAVYGILSGASVALAVARDRATAGRPLAAAATVFTSEKRSAPKGTPTLFIETSRLRHAGGTLIAVDGSTPCDVLGAGPPCWGGSGDSDAVRRQLTILEALIAFLRASVEQDEFARAKLEQLARAPSASPAVPHGPARVRYRGLFHAGGLIGVTFGSEDTSFAAALRPELVLARVREAQLDSDTRTVGLGIYGELGWLSGAGSLGAGVTLTAISGRLGVAPSVGVIRSGGVNGVAGSLFVGLRDPELFPPFDLATGVRFDLRSIDGERTYTASLQLDLVLPVIGIYVLTLFTRADLR